MALTRKEKLLKAMLEDNAAGCLGGVTREERMLAGVAKKTCDNDALEGGGGSSVQPDWDQNDPTAADYVKNRPYYRTTEKGSINDKIGENAFPLTASTVPYNGMNIILDEHFASVLMELMTDKTCEVVFDGKLYVCEQQYSDVWGCYFGAPISSNNTVDFSEYPFVLTQSGLVAETAGEHTVDIYWLKTSVNINYGNILRVEANWNDDRIPYLDMESVEAIIEAWDNGVPVHIDTIYSGSVGVTLMVTEVAGFIWATGVTSYGRGVAAVVQGFNLSDGSLYDSKCALGGSVTDDGNNTYTTMYIKGRWYKITVDSSGNLKATEITY